MNKVRIIVGELFQSPMGSMNFPSYFQYINTAGKITARTMMEIETTLLALIEEQEQVNEQNEANFKQIFDILQKLVNEKEKPITEITTKFDPPFSPIETEEGTNLRKQAIRQQRIDNLAKARAAKPKKDML